MTADRSDPVEALEQTLLDAALRLVAEQGWTWPMAYAAGASAGLSAGETELLAPQGPRDLVALLWRRHDGVALAALAEVDPASLKVRERIRRAVQARLAPALADAPATRRLAGFLALPPDGALGLRLAWASADALWRWAGDRSTDFNHYSKRAILAEVLAGALAIGLSDGEAAALAHLDRRIEQVMGFERFKARVGRGGAGAALAGALGRLRYAVAKV